ncbi:MAG: hypothetical protein ABI230_04370 [Aestuariivirga sp.]
MSEEKTRQIGIGSYIVVVLSFIPLVGIFFAIVAIIMGLRKFNEGGKRLIMLGCLGLVLTFSIYGTLFYKTFERRGGLFGDGFNLLAKGMVTDLVRGIEYYKLVNGRYPEDLIELKNSLAKVTFMGVDDASSTGTLGSKSMPTFFYQLSEDKNHYYLLGVGPDQKPFTADDILPDIPEQERVKTGLLIKNAQTP